MGTDETAGVGTDETAGMVTDETAGRLPAFCHLGVAMIHCSPVVFFMCSSRSSLWFVLLMHFFPNVLLVVLSYSPNVLVLKGSSRVSP